MNDPVAPLGISIPLTDPFDGALARISDALKAEGFGVLTTIDVQAIFKAKLGVDFRKYAILGVCNPTLAHRALTADGEAGLLLPCTVTVEETGPTESLVRIGNPEAMLRAGHFGEGTAVHAVGAEAGARLRRVAQRLGDPLFRD